MEKINLYINSKNRDNNDNINHINISLPNGLLYCNMDEYFILNVNSFYTCANWYNCTSKNNKCQLITKDHDDIVTETINIELPIGNLNVLQIASILNNLMVNHVLIIYDSISNKFTFTRKHHPSPNNYTTILKCISCGNFLGFDNGFRQLPSSFPSTSVLQASGRSSQLRVDAAHSLQNNFDTENSTAFLDTRVSMGLGRNFNIGSVRVNSTNIFGQSTQYQYFQRSFNRYFTLNEGVYKNSTFIGDIVVNSGSYNYSYMRSGVTFNNGVFNGNEF
jgi:hypothetical protein